MYIPGKLNFGKALTEKINLCLDAKKVKETCLLFSFLIYLYCWQI